jgi:hypothetical protein
MPARRVLALIDFNARGEAALRHAAATAAKDRSSLMVVHVIRGDSAFGSDGPGGRFLPEERLFFAARAAARKLDLFLARNDASWAESTVLYDNTEAALARLIARWKPDLILGGEEGNRIEATLRGARAAESLTPSARRRAQFTRTALLGSATALLYWLAFANEALVLEFSAKGHWYFIVPVVIAFVFSFVHGAFTAEFWNALGVRPRRRT